MVYIGLDSSFMILALTSNPSSVDDEFLITPDNFSISSIYPNPFNPEVTIKFSLSIPDDISLNVYDILGRHIDDIFEMRKAELLVKNSLIDFPWLDESR